MPLVVPYGAFFGVMAMQLKLKSLEKNLWKLGKTLIEMTIPRTVVISVVFYFDKEKKSHDLQSMEYL